MNIATCVVVEQFDLRFVTYEVSKEEGSTPCRNRLNALHALNQMSFGSFQASVDDGAEQQIGKRIGEIRNVHRWKIFPVNCLLKILLEFATSLAQYVEIEWERRSPKRSRSCSMIWRLTRDVVEKVRNAKHNFAKHLSNRAFFGLHGYGMPHLHQLLAMP